MRGSLGRFVLVGGTTVVIDAVVYQLLLLAGAAPGPSKALSFIAGAAFAYLANWRFTFKGQHHRWSLVAFVLVYLCALGLNVGANALVLAVLGEDRTWQLAGAFVVATGLSAAWNFLGMARFVFRSSPGAQPAGDPEEVVQRHV